MTWIQTFTGRVFSYDQPTPDMVDIQDIAHALANVCRYAGHTTHFFSVAQHSVLVSQRCEPKDALWGLLHDATEAYVADLARPIKHLPGMQAYRDLEARVMGVIAERFGLEPEMPASVREADNRMLGTEASQLMGEPPKPWPFWAEPYPDLVVEPLFPGAAEASFLTRFATLTAD